MPLTHEQMADIERSRAETTVTRRATVPELENILYTEIPVLNHGFVRVVDYMGDDTAVVQAARVSYGTGTKQVSQDRGLINYLMRHHHTTPFEMCEIKLHVKLPIFVARQWIRHRTASVNEYSARYSILDKEFYVPDLDYLNTQRRARQLERRLEQHLGKGQADLFPDLTEATNVRHLAAQSQSNRQGRDEVLPSDEAKQVLEWMKAEATREYTVYSKLLNEDAGGNPLDEERHGIARELARIVLPTSIYTQWYWKIDLHNLLHFLRLRADAHAQYEIRAYAEVMLDIVKRWVPLVHQAFLEYAAGGAQISATGLALIRRLVRGERVSAQESGLTKREYSELMALLECDA